MVTTPSRVVQGQLEIGQEGLANVSCAQRKWAGRRARLLAVVGSGLALVLTGCGAGQITQTGEQQAAVNGAHGNAGPIAVRNAELAFPSDPNGIYRKGDSAPVLVMISNTGNRDDALVAVRSPLAGGATVEGTKKLPQGESLIAVAPEGAGEGTEGTHATALRTPSHASPGQSPAPGEPAPGESAPGESAPGESPGGSAPAGSSPAESTPAESTPAEPAPGGEGPLERGSVRIVLTGLKADVIPGQTVPVTFVFRDAGEVSMDVPIAAATTERSSGGGGH
ncbi:MAG: copper chaperone PCu(A)C [Pseudonocardiaceae bacterium]|nr:copper chaperone PCu(A)C [Pseudonocardiaceae bacterium]